MAHQPPREPLIAIIGATGTGKSELAVEIARRFNGEVINGDAMQLYHGLPIITNKIPEDQRKGVPHHLLGCIDLSDETWSVGIFMKKALQLIQEIRSRGRLPVLVGGTHYYTQALLFRDALADGDGGCDGDGVLADRKAQETPTEHWPILERPTEEILAELRKVDPVMADRWHPNDRRKIQRSLGIWLQTGRPASEVYEMQNKRRAAASNSATPASTKLETNSIEIGDIDEFSLPANCKSRMRFDTLLLWPYAPSEILRPRLDGRIGTMLSRGLVSEVQDLHRFLESEQSQGRAVDDTRGIWVSIGYKEFVPYISALHSGILSSEELETLKLQAIERTQAATRQYAKRQVRWIRIKLLHALADTESATRLFPLDGSDLVAWADSVEARAADITQAFLNGHALPDPKSVCQLAGELLTPRRSFDVSGRRDLWVRRACETCGMTAVIEEEWVRHLNSQRHRKALKGKAKREERLERETLLKEASDK
ncbi:MAG: hypothetical protein M1819_007396 [Sarea resinae]|nr:MAG: hypothetical protein M1819_007396 [Sarea resinae]